MKGQHCPKTLTLIILNGIIQTYKKECNIGKMNWIECFFKKKEWWYYMKLTYLANGGIIMTLNFNGTTYKQEFTSEQDLKNFCLLIDREVLKLG